MFFYTKKQETYGETWDTKWNIVLHILEIDFE